MVGVYRDDELLESFFPDLLMNSLKIPRNCRTATCLPVSSYAQVVGTNARSQ
jgi:hypothetical protein